jgi:hypothetical protein
MDTVFLRSGKVEVILGTNTVDPVGKVIGYTGVTADVSGATTYKNSAWGTFQAVLTTTAGSGTAIVTIQGSNDGTNWVATALGVISLAGTTGQTDGFTTVAPWKYVRAVLSSLTGTGAACYVLMGV